MQQLFAFSYLFRGLRVLNKPGVRLYVIIPLLINFLIFAVLISVGMSYFGGFQDWLMSYLGDGLWFIAWLLWLIFFLAALLIVFYTFSIIANIIAAPFNSLLSEAVEYHLTGQTPPGSLMTALKEFLPSLKAELSKLIYMLAWSIPLLILFIIPGVNLIAPLFWFMFSGWMMGLQYLDYPFANHGTFFSQQRKRLAGNRIRTTSFGGGIMLATMIPLLNFFVMPAAVAAATILWVERFEGTEEAESET